MRRERACRDALPVVLSRRYCFQSQCAGARPCQTPPRSNPRGLVMSAFPKSILIAALGGEGGGVLAGWIVAAAHKARLPAQTTSVPGVAQRTGATSYYIEYLEQPAPAGREAVFALVPIAGRVDTVIASELLEAGRIIERGFVSPDRTLFIASSSRQLTTMEKMQMGDGRFESQRIHDAAAALAKRYVTLDLDQLAQENGTVVSATMFGALAGAGAFPWSREVCEAVIREGGRGADASLKGFSAAFAAAPANGKDVAPSPQIPARAQEQKQEQEQAQPQTRMVSDAASFASLPLAVRDVTGHGVARMRDFQDEAYGELFLTRMRMLVEAAGNPADPQTAHALEEGARRLALWMAYEDIPRVADLKTRPERFARIRAEAQIQDHQLLKVTEYLKPGAEEIADMLPVSIGQKIMRRVEAGKSLPFLGRGMHVSTTGLRGYFTMRFLARVK
ncbi:MAG: indolepyruvate oxidoreductase subunit beta family protein, partial [Alphaproteobacteria bacterium]|nr:indolepyruvate oxidoreductase subunit beta family protein [Alphaproteobacteria bacterium]